MKIKKCVISVLLVFMACASQAQKRVSPYNLNTTREISLVSAGIASVILAQVLDRRSSPLTIMEISQLDPNSIGRFDRSATSKYSLSSKKTSDALMTAGFILPFALLVHKDCRSDFGTVGLMALETVLVTQGVTGIFKGSTERIRPFVYNDLAPLSEKTTTKAKRSFFSGHTSMYTALSFFTARVLSDYSLNPRVKIVAWTSATVTSAYMARLRVVAGKHFASDVIVGYLVGAAAGIGIPQLHKNNKDRDLTFAPYTMYGATGLLFAARF